MLRVDIWQQVEDYGIDLWWSNTWYFFQDYFNAAYGHPQGDSHTQLLLEVSRDMAYSDVHFRYVTMYEEDSHTNMGGIFVPYFNTKVGFWERTTDLLPYEFVRRLRFRTEPANRHQLYIRGSLALQDVEYDRYGRLRLTTWPGWESVTKNAWAALQGEYFNSITYGRIYSSLRPANEWVQLLDMTTTGASECHAQKRALLNQVGNPVEYRNGVHNLNLELGMNYEALYSNVTGIYDQRYIYNECQNELAIFGQYKALLNQMSDWEDGEEGNPQKPPHVPRWPWLISKTISENNDTLDEIDGYIDYLSEIEWNEDVYGKWVNNDKWEDIKATALQKRTRLAWVASYDFFAPPLA